MELSFWAVVDVSGWRQRQKKRWREWCCLPLLKQSFLSVVVVSLLCVFRGELINGQDTEVESMVEEPDCMQDPLGEVDMVRAASLGTAAACRGTGVPLDNLRVDTQMVPGVCHKHHTWAPLGNWPLGSVGRHRGSCPSAAFSGRGSSRNT